MFFDLPHLKRRACEGTCEWRAIELGEASGELSEGCLRRRGGSGVFAKTRERRARERRREQGCVEASLGLDGELKYLSD